MTHSTTEKPTVRKHEPSPHALSLLAWLALVYTWAIGHGQVIIQWLVDLPGAKIFNAFVPPTWCLFKAYFHLPCMFCGFTRSFILINQGQFKDSWHYHPLGIPVYLLTLAFAVMGVLKPLWSKRLLLFLSRKPSLLLILILLSLGWLWKLAHSPRFW